MEQYITNTINDFIDPAPSFKIEVEKIDEKTIIILNVMKGKDTPYYYKGKAYKRSDTSTLEVDRIEVIQSRDGSEYAPSIKEMCKDKPLMANKLMNIDYAKIHEEL